MEYFSAKKEKKKNHRPPTSPAHTHAAGLAGKHWRAGGASVREARAPGAAGRPPN